MNNIHIYISIKIGIIHLFLLSFSNEGPSHASVYVKDLFTPSFILLTGYLFWKMRIFIPMIFSGLVIQQAINQESFPTNKIDHKSIWYFNQALKSPTDWFISNHLNRWDMWIILITKVTLKCITYFTSWLTHANLASKRLCMMHVWLPILANIKSTSDAEVLSHIYIYILHAFSSVNKVTWSHQFTMCATQVLTV